MNELTSYSKEELGELNILQAVKIRPGMYIGSTSTKGVINLVKSLIDELKPLSDLPIEVRFKLCKNGQFKIKAKGAHLYPLIEFIEPSNEPKTWTNKFIFDLRFFMAFTANSVIEVTQTKAKHYITSKGTDFNIETTEQENEEEQLSFKFKLDPIIFKDLKLNIQLIKEELLEFTYLSPNINICLINDRGDVKTKEIYYFPRGLSEKLQLEIEKQDTTTPCFIFDQKFRLKEYDYHITFCLMDNWTAKPQVKTYFDTDHLYMGGSLEDGIIKGLRDAINESMDNENNIKSKKIKERLMVFAQVKGENACFQGSLKAALDMPVLEKDISEYIKMELVRAFENNNTLLNQLIER